MVYHTLYYNYQQLSTIVLLKWSNVN